MQKNEIVFFCLLLLLLHHKYPLRHTCCHWNCNSGIANFSCSTLMFIYATIPWYWIPATSPIFCVVNNGCFIRTYRWHRFPNGTGSISEGPSMCTSGEKAHLEKKKDKKNKGKELLIYILASDIFSDKLSFIPDKPVPHLLCNPMRYFFSAKLLVHTFI